MKDETKFTGEQIRIGKFRLRMSPDTPKKVHILAEVLGPETGFLRAGQFKTKDLEAAIEKFFEENF